MIFTAIGLLVVALAFLIAGIAKSSVALLVLSVIATVVAGVFLWASFAFYRRAATAAAGEGEPGPRPGWPVVYTGTAAPPTGVMTVATASPVPDGNGTHAGPEGPPVDGWDDLSAIDAAKLVETLNLDELHVARRYEVEHDARKTVLRAIDRRIESIVELRRAVRPA